MALFKELMVSKMGLPDLLPDVIPKERKPSGPPEDYDIDYEDETKNKII